MLPGKDIEQPSGRWREPLRFLAGGGVATLVHWLVMLGLIHAGLGAVPATAAGGALGLAVNYAAQHRFTFRSDLPHRLAFARYLAGASLGWTVNLSVFTALYAALGAAAIAQAVATAVATLANYQLAARFVFQEKPSDEMP